MKKLFLALILALVFVLPIQAGAQQIIISSGLTTSDRLIATGNCSFHGMEIISGASTATVAIYDSITASGTTVGKGVASLAKPWESGPLPFGVEVFTGIYADVTGTGAAYTVYYRCK